MHTQNKRMKTKKMFSQIPFLYLIIFFFSVFQANFQQRQLTMILRKLVLVALLAGVSTLFTPFKTLLMQLAAFSHRYYNSKCIFLCCIFT